MASWKDKRVKGLAGYLDTRSQPDEVGIENFRVVLNASIRGRNKRCRRGGWSKFYSGVNDDYNNEDLHDQLLGLSFYYQGLSKEFFIPGQLTGYVYPYFSPGIDDPSRIDFTFVDTICGYAPDFAGVYDFPIFDGYGIEDPYFVGYPYEEIHADYPYDDPCVGPAPDYWAYSWFRLLYATYHDGQFVEAYEFGDPSPVFTQDQSYVYSYCGSYPYYHETCKEHITFLGSIGSPDGDRTLVAGTKSRLYAFNQNFGNWRIVADGMGSSLDSSEDCDSCPQERWMGAVVGNVMVLTNDYNSVMAYNPLSTPSGCAAWRASVIDDLETLNVLSAGVVGAWKEFAFLADVYQDGARRRNRILWSDYGDPYTWIPDDDNLAGFQDLSTDETILRIEGLNDYLFIYTDKAIYRAALVQTSGSASFLFEEIFRGEEGSLQYKFAFANTGEAHYYWSQNRLVKMTSMDKRPQEPLVLRLCSNSIFEGLSSEEFSFSGLNQDACHNFVGGFNPQQKEVWFSWPTGSNTCANMSMVINVSPGEEGVDFVDSGFNAFHWFDGRRQKSVMEWLEDLQVCERSETLTGLSKEGPPYTLESDTFDDPVQCILNPTEDENLAPSSDSLCAAIEDIWLRDICEKCDTLSRFVMASSTDKALKEYADSAFYREELEGGAYVLNGYDTILESGLSDEGIDDDKKIRSFAMSGTAAVQTTPNYIYGYIGTGPSPECIDWEQLKFYDDDCDTLTEAISLSCFSDYSDDEREDEGLRRDSFAYWPAVRRGRFYGWRIMIGGTGGSACFSRANIVTSKVE